MSWVQVWTVIAAVAGIVGLQSFWIGRDLDGLRREMERGFDQIHKQLERIERQVAGHAERIARVEERRVS